MNKFAIFTAVLVFSVVTVMGDFVVRDYVAKQSETSVILSDTPLTKSQTPPAQVTPPATSPQTTPDTAAQTQPASTTSPDSTLPVEPSDYTLPPPSSKITASIISEAGFTAAFSEKHFEGKVFQLLDITKTPVSAISYYEVTQDNVPIASITEIVLPDEIRALQMYILLQNKTKTYIDLTLNETNAYGDRSFYINHAKKPDEAFLTVKIGKSIYCFAYVKSYHSQIKKLISLLAA